MKKIALILFLFLGAITVRAQVLIQKPANVRQDGNIFSLVVVRGAPPVTLDFVYTGGSPGEPVEWKITPITCNSAPLNPCSTPQLKGGTVNQFTVNTSSSYSLLCKVTVNAGDPDLGTIKTADTTLLVTVRNPIDYSLILDKSGSMSTIMANPNVSRMDALKKGVSIMATKLAEFGTEYDSIGIRFFDYDSVLPASPTLKGSLVPLTNTNLSIIQSTVNDTNAGGNTALGHGMRAGRNQLLNAPAVKGHTKVMFVFSDGEQNSGNLVNPANPRFLTTGNIDLRGTYPTTDTITTYTVCLGVVGDYPHLMAAIADSNPNRYLILENFDSEFPAKIEAGLDAMVNKILKGNSPQFVGIRNKDYAQSGADYVFKEQFVVNKGVHKVFISMVSQPIGRDTITSLTLNGTNVLPYAVKRYGQGYRTFVVNFPLASNPVLTPDGTWEISGMVRDYSVPPIGVSHGAAPAAVKPHYYLSFTVDDHQVHLDYSVGGKSFTTGQTLHPAVKLTRNGAVIKNATIKVGVFAPGVDFGDFIARAGGTYAAPQTGDPGSPGLQKLQELMQDTANASKFRAKENEITLVYDPATETYKGDFNQLNVSGVYQVLYSVMAEDSVEGNIQRFEQNSVMVTHSGVDLSQSGVSILQNNAGQTVITFRPATSTGIFWGPGWAGGIGVNFPGAAIDSVIDLGDGTYKVFVKGKLEGSGSITIGGISVFNGNASALGCYNNQAGWWSKLVCWLLSLGLPAWTVWVILFIILLLLWLIFRKKK